MNNDTNFGPPSCPGDDGLPVIDTRLNHLKCALQNIVDGYGGDIVMSLGRFRQNTIDTDPSNGCDMIALSCDNCGNVPANCQPYMAGGDRYEVLVPLVEGNQNDLIEWVDFNYGTCFPDMPGNPELEDAGPTPLAGSLVGVQRYLQGLQTPGDDPNVSMMPYWVGPGDDPIRDDPFKDIFVGGQQCRPYITILLTDGNETCTANFSDTTNAAA
ncbi:MAG: hypothetical protein AAGC55_22875, partial [Myxococcota bacterium]